MNFGGVFEGSRAVKRAAGARTRQELQTCTFQGTCASNTTKIPREDPQRDTETERLHPFGAPPFRGPTLSGPHLPPPDRPQETTSRRPPLPPPPGVKGCKVEGGLQGGSKVLFFHHFFHIFTFFRYGALSSKLQKKTHRKTLSSKKTFIHDTFIPKRVHPMTLSSKTLSSNPEH